MARTLRRACEEAAARVRATLGHGKNHINAIAEQTWSGFDAVWQATLTPEQRERIGAITDHDRHEDKASVGKGEAAGKAAKPPSAHTAPGGQHRH